MKYTNIRHYNEDASHYHSLAVTCFYAVRIGRACCNIVLMILAEECFALHALHLQPMDSFFVVTTCFCRVHTNTTSSLNCLGVLAMLDVSWNVLYSQYIHHLLHKVCGEAMSFLKPAMHMADDETLSQQSGEFESGNLLVRTIFAHDGVGVCSDCVQHKGQCVDGPLRRLHLS